MIRSFLVSALLLLSPAVIMADQTWSGTGQVQFSGTSTLHNFSGKVPLQPFQLTLSNPDTPASATLSVNLQVKTLEMDTDHKKRDQKMQESLKSDQHPVIAVQVNEAPLAQLNTQWQGGLPMPETLPFTLTLLGQEQELTGTITQWSTEDDQVSCQISFPVSLKASGIKVPAALGLLRVGDTIQVQANLQLTPAG